MGTVVASLIVKVVGQVDDAIRSLNKVDKAVNATAARMKKIGANMASIGKSLTLRATAPLLAFGAVAVNAASDLAESMSAVGTVFGDAAKDVSGFSGSVARDLGLSRQEALQAATTFGAMGKQIGLTGKDLSDFSNGSIQAAADLASFYNAPVPEALAAIQSGLQGEAEPLRRFGIFLSDATLNQYALAKGIGKTTQEMTEQEKIALRQQYIMENLGAAQGDFARTSGGLANQLRIAKAEMMDIAAQLGTILLPYVLQAVGIFREWAQRFADLSPRTQKIIVVMAGLVAVLGPLLVVLGTAVTAIAALGPALALLTGPVGLVILALVGLGIAYKKNLFGFRDAVNKIVKPVVAAFQRLYAIFKGGKGLGKALEGLPTPLQKLAIAARRVVVIFGSLIRGDFGKAAAQFTKLKQTVSNFFTSLQTGIPILDHVIQFTARTVQRFITIFEEVVGLISALVRGDWSEAWNHLGTIAQLAWEQLIDYLKNGLTLWKDVWRLVVSAVRDIDWGGLVDFLIAQGTSLIGGLYDAAEGFVTGTLLPWLGDLAGLLVDAVPDLVGTLTSKGRDLLTGLYTAARGILTGTVLPWLGGLAGRILGATPDLLVTLAGKGADLLQGLYDGITGPVWDTVKDFFGRLPGRVAGFVPDDIKTRLSGAGRAILRGFKNGVQEIFDTAIKPWFGTIALKVLDALPAIGVLLGTLTKAGEAIADGLWAGVQAGWKPVKDFFSGIGDTIAGILNAVNWDTVTAAFKPLTELLGNIVSGLNTIKGWVTGGGGGDAGAGTGNQVQTGGEQTTLKPVSEQVLQIAFEPGNALSEIAIFVTDVVKHFTDMHEKSTSQMVQLRQSAQIQFSRMNRDASSQVKAMHTDISRSFTNLYTGLTGIARQTRSSISNEFVGLRNDLLSIIGGGTVPTKFYQAFTTGVRQPLMDNARGTRASVANQAVGLRSDLLSIIGSGTTAGMVTSAWNSGVHNPVKGRAEATRAAIANEWVGARSDIVSIAGSIGPRVRDALSFSLYGPGQSAGSSFGQGVYSGALAWQTDIYNAGAQLATQLIAGFKISAGIASPSKKAMLAAAEIPHGMVIALDRGLTDVARAGGRLAGAAFGSASGSWNVGGSGVAPVAAVAGGSRGGDTYNFDIDVSVQGGGDVEGLGSAIARAVLRESHVKGKPKGFR